MIRSKQDGSWAAYTVMTRYTIRSKQDGRLLATASAANVREVVYELSGRDVLGYASVREHLRRTGRAYVSCGLAGTAGVRGLLIQAEA